MHAAKIGTTQNMPLIRLLKNSGFSVSFSDRALFFFNSLLMIEKRRVFVGIYSLLTCRCHGSLGFYLVENADNANSRWWIARYLIDRLQLLYYGPLTH